VSDAGPAALAGVLFDMDGLLVDTEPIWFEVEISVMARLGASAWTPADQHELVGGSLTKSVDYMISRAARPADPDQVATWLVDGMAELLRTREIEPMPGAVELIGAVRRAGLPYALVTSSERVIADAVLGALARRGVIEDRPGLHVVGSLAELDLEALRGLVARNSLGVLLDEGAAG
jgi:beta-phosphoglucomutase-like phosphatase (HAD superfamily)